MNGLNEVWPADIGERGFDGVDVAQLRLPKFGWSAGEVICVKSIVERIVVLLTMPIWGTVIGVLWLLTKCTDPQESWIFLSMAIGLKWRAI